MNNLTDIQTMSSLEIAEVTGKQHKHVMADVRKMLNELGESDSSFLRTRRNSQNKEQTYFLLDHDLTMTLVSGYSVKLLHAAIVRLRTLNTGEAKHWHLQEPKALALPDFTNPAEAART